MSEQNEQDFKGNPYSLKFWGVTVLCVVAGILLQAVARFLHPVVVGTLLTLLIFAPKYIDNCYKNVPDSEKIPLYYRYLITMAISLLAGAQFDQGNFKWLLDSVKGYLFSGHSEI